MNLAFSALILLLLLTPGFIFRVAYLNTRYTTVVNETLLALIPAFFIQVLGFLFVEKILRTSVSVGTFYQLIINAISFKDFEVVRRSLGSFLLYNIIIWILSWNLGLITRKAIRYFRLDRKFSLLKFENNWYPVLKGTFLQLPGYEYLRPNIQLVWIDVVVETKEGSYIYSGIIDDFFMTKDDGIDRFHLKNVRRRKLSDDLPTSRDEAQLLPQSISSEPDHVELETDTDTTDELDKRYYYMPGDFFIIPYSQIKNMNITYYNLDEES